MIYIIGHDRKIKIRYMASMIHLHFLLAEARERALHNSSTFIHVHGCSSKHASESFSLSVSLSLMR